MRIAGIDKNDAVNGEGVSVSIWFQGCPHHCFKCHNPETWDQDGGKEINRADLLEEIKKAIIKNGIVRNVSFLGGEPLAPYNVKDAIFLAQKIKEFSSKSKIYLWTGYTIEDFTEEMKEIYQYVDVIIDGKYIDNLRDITLPLRGSSNQRIIPISHNKR